MKKNYYRILQTIFQCLILRYPVEKAISSVIILVFKPDGNGVFQDPVSMILYLF